MVIWSDKVYIDRCLIEAAIVVENGIIKAVMPGSCPRDVDVNLEGFRVIPGLIDTHIHGCVGADTMDATYDALNTMSKYLALHGVTSFVPTTVTSSEDEIREAIINVTDTMECGCTGAKVLGINIEGPFLSSQYSGAHIVELLEEISIERVDNLLKGNSGTILNITVAPEQMGALEAISYLRSNGINVSIGHSEADYEHTMGAVEAGANRITHIYNGMPPMHHRKPGVLGAALTSDTYAEIICDGIHVEAPMVEIALRCKGTEKMVLITDCIRAGGMRDGKYTLGLDSKVVVSNGIARLIDDNTLAGSTLSLDRALANYIEMTGEPFERAVLAAIENPARSLGVFNKVGSIEPGKCADIIAIDDELRPIFVMIDGGIFDLNKHARKQNKN